MQRALSIFFSLLSFTLALKTSAAPIIPTATPGKVQGTVQEFILDNGLKIIVKEDHRAPIAISMVWYHVGSADEPSGMTGVSHALEHMMFKGTHKFPLGVFSKKIAEVGGQENAMTSYDYTAFYEKTSASQLPISLELEADRMQDLLLNAEEFSKEIKVIREERRQRTDDNPISLTHERYLAAAHLSAPYQHPVVGWMGDLMHLNIQDVRAWYENFYAPNNATLVVVGDVEASKVRDLAHLYFGSIKRRPDYIRKALREPVAFGAKSLEVHAPAQIPMIMFGYTVPSLKSSKVDWEPYALQLIAGILNAGESARLPKTLIRGKQLASNMDIEYEAYARYQTQFVFMANPSAHHTVNEIKAAVLQEIQQLQKTPVTVAELQRIKTQIIAQKTFEKDSIMGQAMELGVLESVGIGHQNAQLYMDKINAVTAEQILTVAKKYFVDNSMTEARLMPKA